MGKAGYYKLKPVPWAGEGCCDACLKRGRESVKIGYLFFFRQAMPA